MFSYNAKIVNVVDGDTADVSIDLGFDVVIKKRLRLEAVDTAELFKPSNKAELCHAIAAKEYFISLLKEKGNDVVIKTSKTDKYGRYVAQVYFPQTHECLNSLLMEANMSKLPEEEYEKLYMTIVEAVNNNLNLSNLGIDFNKASSSMWNWLSTKTEQEVIA